MKSQTKLVVVTQLGKYKTTTTTKLFCLRASVLQYFSASLMMVVMIKQKIWHPYIIKVGALNFSAAMGFPHAADEKAHKSQKKNKHQLLI